MLSRVGLLGLIFTLFIYSLTPPVEKDSLRFAVIGDSGTGGREALEIGQLMAKSRATFPFEFVVMLGDNIYGGEKPRDFEEKFEVPYKALLDGGVKFYASLGNHDDPKQAHYKLFNMNGERYYTFKPRDGMRFFAIDTTYVDKKQLEWLEAQLKESQSDWKIAFFHHPLYSSGEKHGPNLEMRTLLEPLFIKYGVDVVLSGHEHFYERIKPQSGIGYFIVGSSAKLRKDNVGVSELTAKAFDTDRAFMVVELTADKFRFQTISRTGDTVDSGELERTKR